MRFLLSIVAMIGTLLGSIYIVLFTPLGNTLVQTPLENKINETLKLESRVDKFSLTMNKFELLLEINKNNTVHLKGNYSLFSQSFNIAYRLTLQELQTLNSLTETSLRGSFSTEGSVKGNKAYIEVDGVSSVASSKTSYHIELTDLNPTSIIAKVQNIDLEKLLYIVNQKPYVNANVDIDIDFKNIRPHFLDGKILLTTKAGKINSKIMKKDFNLKLPNTLFKMNLEAILKGDNIDYKYILDSTLAKILSSGDIKPKPLALDIKYTIAMKELAILEPLLGVSLHGKLALKGTIQGNKKNIALVTNTDFASSKSNIVAKLKDFKLATLRARVRSLNLKKALYMLNQPPFASGLLDLDVNIHDADMTKLKATVTSKITQGVINSKYFTKTYKFTSAMPYTTFSAKSSITVDKTDVKTKLTLLSNLLRLDVNEMHFNTDNNHVESDYKVTIAKLNKLFFISQRALKGSITAKGRVSKKKDLDLTLMSSVGGGELEVKLHNDDLRANFKAMKTLSILDMLLYPKIFNASLDGSLKYNLLQEKGVLKGKLSHGLFTKNEVFNLIKKYAYFDIYKEKFEGNVNARINKDNVLTSLNLKSNRSSITTENTKLNTKTSKIDSKLAISANGNPVDVRLKGDITAPKVSVNVDKLIKKEATKVITKELNKLFKGLF